MTNLFQRLRDLVPLPPVLVGIVIEHHDDDTSTVEIPGNLPVTGYSGTVATGSLIRPRGTTVPVGQKAFVRAGVIETRAPDVEPIDIPVGIVVVTGPVIYDTFTDTNGVKVPPHFGEIGADWTMNLDWGVGLANQLEVQSNKLRRVSGGVGESGMVSSASVAGNCEIELILSFTVIGGPESGFINISTNGGSEGNSDILLQVSSGASNNIDVYSATGSFSFTANTEYTVLATIVGTAITVKVNGTSVLTGTIAAAPAGPIAVHMHDQNGDSVVGINSIKVTQ